MPIRIKLHEATIEVDNISEFKSVVAALGLRQGNEKEQHVSASVSGQVSASEEQNNSRKPLGLFKAAVRRLLTQLHGSQQADLITALARAENGLTDAELRERFQIRNNMALSGVMSSIPRVGAKFGLQLEDIIKRETGVGADGKGYRYRLSLRFLDAFTQLHEDGELLPLEGEEANPLGHPDGADR